MRGVVVALLLAGLFAGGAGGRVVPAEDAAIASFVSIGLTNAPTNFAAIRGAQVGDTLYGVTTFVATKSPSSAFFAPCTVSHFLNWSYECHSTPRSESRDGLFAKIAAIVKAGLPPSFASRRAQGYQTTDPSMIWSRSGSPNVALTVSDGPDGSVYRLSINVQS